MDSWVIEKLRSSHDRSAFTCGDAQFDIFIRTLVSQYERRRLGRTFVATRGDARVLGYYTAAARSISVAALPKADRKRLPQHPVPTILLGRLAVDKSCQGQSLGRTLLFHFLSTALSVADVIGVLAVDVVATDDPAKRFYLKYGFLSLEDHSLHLYLPMRTVERMFSTDGATTEGAG